MKFSFSIPDFQQDLLTWYHQKARSFPWRMPPDQIKNNIIHNPYHVWLSEIMLQQTTTKTVIDYFKKFISLYPTIESLASAPLDDVLHAWAGLGYYSRARNLHATAKIIAEHHNGIFPSDIKSLKNLKGIGDYTAGAIMTIAFGKKSPVIDGNVHRILTRIFTLKGILPPLMPVLKEYAYTLTPEHESGNYVQALMDLGATICTPLNSDCPACPLKKYCLAYETKQVSLFPEKPIKKTKPVHYGVALIVEDFDTHEIILQKNPEKGLFGGLYLLPYQHYDPPLSYPIKQQAYCVTSAHYNTDQLFEWITTQKEMPSYRKVKHVFTHFTLFLDVIHLKIKIKHLLPQQVKCPINQISFMAMPKLMHKALDGIFVKTP